MHWGIFFGTIARFFKAFQICDAVRHELGEHVFEHHLDTKIVATVSRQSF